MSAVTTAAVEQGRGSLGLRAPRRARVWAAAAALWVGASGALTFAGAVREVTLEAIAAVVLAAFSVAVALLAVAVRAARLRVDEDGVRWGWRIGGFTMPRHKIAVCRVYRDVVALIPRRGFAWYLSGRDWAGFDGLPAALERARIPVEPHPGRAPLLARLQGYGMTLDLILVLNVILATALAV